jgi:hypothetical protein
MCKWLPTLIALVIVACSHRNPTPEAAASPQSAAHQQEHQHEHRNKTAAAAPHQRFAVRHFVGAESNPTEEVGVIDVAANGTLVVEKAEGEAASELREAVATMNNANSVPADGVNEASTIERGKPGFFEGEREHLRKYYGFELTPL